MLKKIKYISSDNIRKILLEQYKNDNNVNKINLLRGVYKNNYNKPLTLESVKNAKKLNINNNHEYLSTDGDYEFLKLSNKFIYGEEDYNNSNIKSIQSLSGTGALRIGAEYINKYISNTIYIPNYTWSNHDAVFNASGLNIKTYEYFNKEENKIEYSNYLNDLNNLPDKSVILLHSCAHNPTGTDPTNEQWKEIADIIKTKNHIPFFDNAYQGFASGDYNKDAFSHRYFLQNNIGFLLAHSYSKNFGLYGERVGLLSFHLNEQIGDKKSIKNKMNDIIRPMYSCPPLNGSNLVKTILSNEQLFEMWKNDCSDMSLRINTIREKIANNVTNHNLDYITNQIGMFGFLNLSEEQIDLLISKYSIYLPYDGRISLSGLNDSNIDYFTDKLNEILI